MLIEDVVRLHIRVGDGSRCAVWELVMVSFPPCDSPLQVVVITRLGPQYVFGPFSSPGIPSGFLQ